MDARLNDLIRLKQPPSAPLQRWQMITGRPNSRQVVSKSPPLRPRTNPSNVPNPASPIVYKRSPKIRKTPCQTAGHSKTPSKARAQATGKTRTPGRTGRTPGAGSCRFIPNRSTTDFDYSSYLVRSQGKPGMAERVGGEEEEEEEEEEEAASPSRGDYLHALHQAASGGRSQKGVLSFKATPSFADSSLLNYTAPMSNSASFSCSSQSHRKKAPHKIPTAAEKIMDAPNLMDDYYLNNLDWGRNNCLAIGLGSVVYIWNATDNTVEQLAETSAEDIYVSSVAWAGNGKYLAIGSSDAEIALWDVCKKKRVRVMKGHRSRVSSLAWNSHTLASGSHDGSVQYHDVRQAEHCTGWASVHTLEVCGLRWSADGRQLASGGNDNMVIIWGAGTPVEPLQVLRGHQAAVKALSWCPWQRSVLASGGGTRDKCIRIWNTATGECTASVDTKSQVSALAWNREYREIISAHGEPRHQMAIWKYPSLCKVGELVGHEARILHMVLSPHKTSIASAAADETLRVWKCFESSNPLSTSSSSGRSQQEKILAMIQGAGRGGQ